MNQVLRFKSIRINQFPSVKPGYGQPKSNPPKMTNREYSKAVAKLSPEQKRVYEETLLRLKMQGTKPKTETSEHKRRSISISRTEKVMATLTREYKKTGIIAYEAQVPVDCVRRCLKNACFIGTVERNEDKLIRSNLYEFRLAEPT